MQEKTTKNMLMNEANTTSIEKAITNAKKRWKKIITKID